jgi:5-methylcytosine-specific restriction protein A
MPTAPQRPCLHPGCSALVPSGYCAAHAKNRHAEYDKTRRKDDPRLREAARIRSGRQWQEVRAIHKARNPLCCDPFNLEGRWKEPTYASHHVVPLIERPDMAYDMTNLAPLCMRCHNRIEAMERDGQETQSLFASVTQPSI